MPQQHVQHNLDLFRFLSQLPSQQSQSLFEKSILFFLFFVVFREGAYQTSTQITALICEDKCAAFSASLRER